LINDPNANEGKLRPYTISEAADLLRVGRNQAYQAAKSGELPCIRLGKRILVPRAALDRILAEGTKAA
jgi:excisionase family DNA binding protein